MKKTFFTITYIIIFAFSSFAQNVIELESSSGISLQAEQITQLETIAEKIKPSFKSEANFDIIDCSFYSFNDEMGESQESFVWDDFKGQASQLSNNFLLFGRQYTSGQSGFKLWIHLGVEKKDLECYVSEDDKLIEDNLILYQTKLKEWYEYLTIETQESSFGIQLEVADLLYYKLIKVCCESTSNRSLCLEEDFDPQSNISEIDFKKYILGQLKCLLFNAENGCLISLSEDSGIGGLANSLFNEHSGSKFVLDEFYKFGNILIYPSETPVNFISCNVVPDDTKTVEEVIGSSASIQRDVRIYDLGKITVVIEKKYNEVNELASLYDLLTDLKYDYDDRLQSIFDKMNNNTNTELVLTIEDQKLLDYSAECDFESLDDKTKITLFKLFIDSDNSISIYAYGQNYFPLFLVHLYESIVNKTLIFEEQQKDLKFTHDFLSFNYSSEIRESLFAQYISDYLTVYMDVLGEGDDASIQIGGTPLNSITNIHYEVDKYLAFYLTDYQILFSEDSRKVIIKIVHKEKYPDCVTGPHTNCIKTTWVPIREEPFDLFEPIYIESIDVPHYKSLAGVLPVAMLVNLKNYFNSENQWNAISLGVDVASTLLVFGNLSKLRHLGKVKLFFGGAEITLTIGNNLVKYTNLIENDDKRKEVSFYLSMFEIAASLGTISLDDVNKINSVRNYGDNLASDLSSIDAILYKDIIIAIRQSLGAQGLLKRLERLNINAGDDIYDFVNSVDQVQYYNALNRVTSASDNTLIKIGQELNTAQCSKLFFDLNNLENSIELANLFEELPNGVSAWRVLDDMVDDIGVAWKTDIPTLTKFSDDIALNPNLEGWLKSNSGYFNVWNSVKHVPSSSRVDIGFLQAFKKIKDDLPLQKHIAGELKVEVKSYGYKIRVSGYHKNLEEIDLPSPLHGNAGISDPNNPNNIITVSIGTASNPATKGKIWVSNKLNENGGELPFTAQIDAEIPPGSGNFFPKKGHDGINTDINGNYVSGRSSIFPENWSESKILEEIAYVRRNMTASDLDATTNIYSRLNSEGTFKIGMYIDGNLTDMTNPIGSAFPQL